MQDPIIVGKEVIQKIWTSPSPSDSDLAKYFEVDDSSPLSPVLKIKKNVTIVNDDGTTISLGEDGHPISLGLPLDFLNSRSRKNRVKRYNDFLIANPKSLKIVSEGDSWFLHPFITDTIDYLSKYFPIYCLSAAGDTFRNMHRGADWLNKIREIRPKVFMISAGGNDILGEQFEHFLVPFTDGFEPGENPSRFVNKNLLGELESIKSFYKDVFESIKRESPDVHMITHGYDHVIPNNLNVPAKWYQRKDKSWLGDYMIKNGIKDSHDKQSIIVYIMNIFNENLAALAKQYPNVHYIDLRGTVRDDQWYDEIHPNSNGYQDISLKFKDAIRAIT